jgi:tetratricopeptide (TPR) repeat protein
VFIIEEISNCYKCGSKLPLNSNYCYKCGFKLRDPQETDSIYSANPSKRDSYYFEKTSQKYYVSGLTHYKKGESKKAIEEFTKAIKLKNDFAEAYYQRGQSYIKEARYEDAIDVFTKAIEIDPEFKDAYFQRGNIFFEK